MLDPWIIEEILKKEEQARREEERQPELPVERYRPDMGEKPTVTPAEPESERGVMIIDI